MALSVIRIGYGENSHGLYCSTAKSIILVGQEDEISHTKNIIEEAQQQADNKEYMDILREERMNLLISGGNSHEDAEQFLKKQMPYLWK